MIAIFAAVLAAATAKEAKGKYLKFTANVRIIFSDLSTIIRSPQ